MLKGAFNLTNERRQYKLTKIKQSVLCMKKIELQLQLQNIHILYTVNKDFKRRLSLSEKKLILDMMFMMTQRGSIIYQILILVRLAILQKRVMAQDTFLAGLGITQEYLLINQLVLTKVGLLQFCLMLLQKIDYHRDHSPLRLTLFFKHVLY